MRDPAVVRAAAAARDAAGDVLASYLRWVVLSPRMQAFLRGRIARGVATYGVRLTAHNGRDALLDAAEELADALLYLHQARLEGRAPEADPLVAEALRLLPHVAGGPAGLGPAGAETLAGPDAPLHGSPGAGYISPEGQVFHVEHARGDRMAWMKVLKLVPVLVDVIADVERKIAAAKAEGSAGGSKLTGDEIAKIVLSEIGPLVAAIVASF